MTFQQSINSDNCKCLLKILIIILISLVYSNTLNAQVKNLEKKSIAKSSIDKKNILFSIDSLMRISYANGILIKNGVIINQWEYDKNINEKTEVQSITKSIVSLLLGIAIDKGLINNINDEVIKYYPQFSAGKYSKNITFKHLVTVSSGISAKKHKENYGSNDDMPPGMDARYHNDHFDLLAKALTYIFNKPLIEVLKKNILGPLDINAEWPTDGEIISKTGIKIPVNAGYAFMKWTASDLAKIGKLYLLNGKWKNKQLISQNYIKESLTPISIPLMISRPNQELRIDSNNSYGYGWRSIIKSNKEHIWYMSGNGGQFCVIIPKKKLVFVKINGYSEKYKPYKGLSHFLDMLTTL